MPDDADVERSRRVEQLRRLVESFERPAVQASHDVAVLRAALSQLLAVCRLAINDTVSPSAARTELPLTIESQARVIDLRTAVEIATERARAMQAELKPNAETFVSGALLRLILDMPAGVKPVVNERDIFTVFLRVDGIPDVPRGRPLHLVQFIYDRVETGAAVLKEMKITLSEERDV